MTQTPLNLSKTEIIVLTYVAKGLQNKEISESLCKSEHTIKNHKANCCLKLGFETTFLHKISLVIKKKWIYFILIVFLSSCKHDYIKIKDKIEGSWKIVEFECYDSEGKIIKKDFVPYTMTFQNPLEEGFIKVDSDKQIEFYYNFSYQVFDGYAKCNIGIKKLIPELPVEMIGRTNVFDYKFLTKKKIEFFNEEEYDLTNQRKLFKVKYIFEKLD